MRNETEAQKKLVQVALSREEFAVSKCIATLHFRRRILGVDGEEVWRGIERLIYLYEDALASERGKRELAERKLEALSSREVVCDG